MDRNILFTCPRTGMNVQHRLPDPDPGGRDLGNSHMAVACLACGAVHFINTATGGLLGAETAASARLPADEHGGRAS